MVPKRCWSKVVKYAVQVFSKSVAATIDVCVRNKLFKPDIMPFAKPTADLVRNVNYAYDALN